MKEFKVVKFGSELVTNKDGVDYGKIEAYADGLAEQLNKRSLIVVTSGAVAAGEARERKMGRDTEKYSASTLAQLGCASIMRAWELAFEDRGVSSGGLLVTHHELGSKNEGTRFVEQLYESAGKDIVSIINENDALSNFELMQLACGGDNDGLACHIAEAVNAKELTLFTGLGGIVDQYGELISRIDETNAGDVHAMLLGRAVEEKGRGIGRGGIVKKFEAARLAASIGIKTQIAAVNDGMSGNRVTEFMVG
jgi:glutamate 5-kinase